MTLSVIPRGDVQRGQQFLRDVSNTLGWAPHNAKQRRAMLQQVLVRRADSPLFTWPNLYLTIELLRRQRQQVGSPLFVFRYVQDAVDAASPVIITPIEDLVRAATQHEQERCADGWQEWVTRLYRASGQGRQIAYDQWLAAGRAP